MHVKASSLLLLAGQAVAGVLYAGVNQAGGEFGLSANGKNTVGLPGDAGSFAFINPSTIDIWVEKNKINFFRVNFLLERMCPPETGLGSTFNETYFSMYEEAINYITNKGAYAALNPQNFMRYGNPANSGVNSPVIGSNATGAATTKQFELFWQTLAGRFANNPRVIFGIMNEPNGMPTQLVFRNDQAAIEGIRAAKAGQLILAPGNQYTGGHAWTKSQNGEDPSSSVMAGLKDPMKNFAVDIHEYLDPNFGGSYLKCNQSFPANMQALTQWLQANNLKAFVSEIGSSDNPSCTKYMTDAIDYMHKNDEYIGWAAWAAGPKWGSSSACCGQTLNGTQTNIGSLEPGTFGGNNRTSLYDTLWNPTIQPMVPTSSLKLDGMSTVG